ncbi:phage integrase family protein [Candidatus Magnetobacterium bavaricum]|uniref:Phage integrase family protein n=1 Tax=Candidatus Magnetobacterium bavaricum TaxID=29290 RepID=A0A0F3GKS0_9BACT|nr:phage integrase family protein [Candidatus Magnetobacterium bavaricum]
MPTYSTFYDTILLRNFWNLRYIKKLKENNVRTGYFEHNKYIELRDALPKELRPVFIMAYYSGMRKETILNMLFSQIDFDSRSVILHSGTAKNDDALHYHLPDELHDAIVKQKEIRDIYYPDCQHVFFREGKKIKDFRGAWETALRKCGYLPTFKCKECNIVIELKGGQEKAKLVCPSCNGTKFKKDDRIFHDLRRTAVRNLIRSGTPEVVAMKITGHKTRSVFDRYNIVNDDDLIKASKNLSTMHQESEERLKSAAPVPSKKRSTHLRVVK